MDDTAASWPSQGVGTFGDDSMREMYLKELAKPLLVDAPTYEHWGSFEWELESEPIWKEPLGEKLCIIDLDNRPFDRPGEVFSDKMTWDNASQVHGLSVGFLNHWLYGRSAQANNSFKLLTANCSQGSRILVLLH